MKVDTKHVGFEKFFDANFVQVATETEIVLRAGYQAATERALRAVEFVYKERGDIDDAESACREIRRLIEEDENL